MANVKVLYICSAGHSGSTLLDLLLGSHSCIESLGEISHLPKNVALDTVCTCGEKISTCAVWQEFSRRLKASDMIDLYKEPYKFNLGYFDAVVVRDTKRATLARKAWQRLVRGLEYQNLRYFGGAFTSVFTRSEQAIRNNFKLYEIFAEMRQVDWVVDSSKSYIKAVSLYRQRPDSVRIILLTRDGRAVMYSNIKRGFGRNKGLRGWLNVYRRGLPLLRSYIDPAHIFVVKYEELVASPERILSEICRFAGLDFEESMLDFSGHEHHSTNGNDMRFSNSSKIIADTKWLNQISKEDRDYFDKCGSDLNIALGYR